MKRLFLILTVGSILFTLLSCNSRNNEPDRNNYTDNYVYAMWKTPDTSVSTLYRINVLHATGAPVCPDPLCAHNTSDCPFYGIDIAGSGIVGSSIYYLRDSVPMKYCRQMCRFNLDSGKLEILHENNAATIAKVFYYRFQKEPLLIGDIVDEDSGERKKIFDARGTELYVCDFDGQNDRLLCDIAGSGYLFGITNSMLWSSGNGEYYCTTLISSRQSEDGQTVECGNNAIVVINIKTGSYRIAEME